MAKDTSRQPGATPAAGGPDVPYLWQLMAQDVILGFCGPPEFEGRLAAHSCLALSGLPSADFNMGIVAGGDDAAARLREYHHLIAAADLPVILVLAGAVAEPLAPVARALGLTHAGNAPLMVYEPGHPSGSSGNYTVERVTDKAGFEAARDMCGRAFGFSDELNRQALPPTILERPGLDYFLARRDGEPRSSVITVRHGPFVGIYEMATPPECQRQGAGRALLEYVIAHQIDRGATTFYLVATQQGYPLYERIGFATVDTAAIWLAGMSTQFS